MLRHLCFSLILLTCSSLTLAADTPKGTALLTVSGNISQSNLVLDEAQLSKLPQKEIKSSTPWYSGVHTFTGPSLKDVLTLVGSKGKQLHLKAVNDYTITIPSSDAELGAVLARKIDGKSFSTRDKGPFFLIFPFDSNKDLQNKTYYARSIWQLVSIKVE